MSVLEDGEERSYKLAGWHDSTFLPRWAGLGGSVDQVLLYHDVIRGARRQVSSLTPTNSPVNAQSFQYSSVDGYHRVSDVYR